MKFSQLMAAVEPLPDGARLAVPEDWMQGRSVFGGLQAALLVRAMRAVLPEPVLGLPLRTLQTTFLAPVPAGTMRAQARVLRSGKSAVHVEARLVDGEQALCVAIGIFGAGRPSTVVVEPRQAPLPAGPAPIPFRFVRGLTPEFTQHFAMRWRSNTPPFTGSTATSAVIEVDLLDGEAADEAAVLAIADVIPPLALSMLKSPAPGSSMTWTIELLRQPDPALPLCNWRLDIELCAAAEGYTSQSVMVWAPDGRALALSRQNMVVFG